MAIYLGLGGNQGDRRGNIEFAIDQLKSKGFRVDQVSPIVETPAMLPVGAKSSWNRPFLNCVVSGHADWTPQEGLVIAKNIEAELGRKSGQRWAPRPMDIDLLIWNDLQINSESLTIPHYGIADRAFVLTPLLYMQPDLIIPGKSESIFQLTEQVKPVPLWMAIINITPDSFSDGGVWSDQNKLQDYLHLLIDHDVPILDLGAESTRPNADVVSADEEWARLEPVLQTIHEKIKGKWTKPLISVDSRNPKTLERCLKIGMDIVNDVSGLTDPGIVDLVKTSGMSGSSYA